MCVRESITLLIISEPVLCIVVFDRTHIFVFCKIYILYSNAVIREAINSTISVNNNIIRPNNNINCKIIIYLYRNDAVLLLRRSRR